MKCRECRFWHNEGDGFGDCSGDRQKAYSGEDLRQFGFDVLIVRQVQNIGPCFIMGSDYGCVHAESRLMTGADVLQALVTAIGRHPAAEADPEIADAVNRIEDALRETGNLTS